MTQSVVVGLIQYIDNTDRQTVDVCIIQYIDNID